MGQQAEQPSNAQTNTSDDLANRAGIYRVLAHMFRKELTTEVVDRLQKHDLLGALSRGGYEIEQDKLNDPDFLKQLSIEYTRIFIGPGKHISPYGSVHHPDDAKKGRLWGDTTVWVRLFARDHGLELKGKAYDGIPDHIGHEFELMSRLVAQESVERQNGDLEKADRLRNSQKIFFTQQLDKWAPQFCTEVAEAARLPFYKGVARLTVDFMALERERLLATG